MPGMDMAQPTGTNVGMRPKAFRPPIKSMMSGMSGVEYTR